MRSARPRGSLPALSALVLAALVLAVLTLEGCAKAEENRRRDAGAPDASVALDVGAGGDDAGAPLDAGPLGDAFAPLDAPVTPEPDAALGRGAYLDRCASAADCASGRCVADLGRTSFCTRACTSDAQCASEHLCVDGQCVADDIGSPCSAASFEACATRLCAGNPATGLGHCTRSCVQGSDCPAGYACQTIAPATRICVDIERPCASASECHTGLCLGTLGCTSSCESALDCPRRLDGLPPYTCELVSGQRVCVPPSDVQGSDAAGASCRTDGAGLNLCRSGACDPSAPLGPMCTQACTVSAGCGAGLGCFPLVDDDGVTYVCALAGGGDLTEPCSTGRACASGLCEAGGYCTRLCADGLCPTGYRCELHPGLGVAICRR